MQLTTHAIMRCKRRGISLEDVAYVLQYGTYAKDGNGWRVRLRVRDIPEPDRGDRERCARLTRLVVITDRSEQVIITAYYRPQKHRRPHQQPLGA